ncbi:MAG: helix-turn-helix domain-containing protein [Phycisphaerae bacterium]|nr:helix-turn-helix domain-containing protein [Phycisphaerae bacterium]
MKDLTPIYHKSDKIIFADRCKPLIEAADAQHLKLHGLARASYPGLPLRTKDLPGLLSVGIWDAPKNQQWGLTTHYNEGIEVTFLETGKLVFEAEKKYTLEPGDMTITRPWQPHSLGDPNITPSRLHWIILDVDVRKPHQKWQWPQWLILDPEDLKQLTILLRQNENPVWSAGNEIAGCFKKIAHVLTKPENSLQISRLTILINELFLSLYESLKKRQMKLKPELITSHRTVELFLQSLSEDQELLSREWTIDSMADYCHLGVTHFTRLCKLLSNMTPIQYLNHQRIEAAAIMMRQKPDLSMTEVAFRCGFNSSQYFATVFKRLRGCTPKVYKNSTVIP